MIPIELLLGTLSTAVVALAFAAVLLAAALTGRGPLNGFGRYGRWPARQRGDDFSSGREAEENEFAPRPSRSATRLAIRMEGPGRSDELARRGLRPPENELDEVLRGRFAIEVYNRAVRIVVWSFILIILLTVSVGQVWQSVEPQIVITLTLAGIFVVVMHELLPPGQVGTFRVIVEGSAAIAFVTALVLLTGHATSPFFIIYPLLVGGAALIAPPVVAGMLTLETVVCYGLAFATGPLDAASERDSLTRIAINLTVLLLLAYSGSVVARVQRRTREAAIRLSTVDSLTDLYNRAYFFNAIDREIHRSRRFQRGFCLLMMDLDGLKSINDRYGHFEGDVVLREVAQLIRSALRRIDVAARYGGDEFVALLTETDPSGAYVVAEKIRQLASEMLVVPSGHQISTSLSIGVVSYPDDGHTADELMIAADEAMYASKRLGKNRVVGYARPDEPAQTPTPVLRAEQSTPGFRSMPQELDDRSRSDFERD
jgi:diguanylate cyclase (GGDEF)-like protein